MLPLTDILSAAARAYQDVLTDISEAAPLARPLLLHGERGTGKSTLAKQVHRMSGRRGRFIAKPVSWIQPEMEVATLAGHKRGSFTGAISDTPGLIEQADQGTLFLDELGDASPRLQSLLLEVLEGKTITRIGDDVVRRVDVRLIAATNADLSRLARDGRFRFDLLDRFGYLVYRLPTLAERREEIPRLVQGFLQAMMVELDMGTLLEPSADVMELLYKAEWPGNIRQLESLCAAAAVKARAQGESLIEVHHLPAEFLDTLGIRLRAGHHRRRSAQRALLASGGNKSAAAREMGVSRTTLYKRLKQLRNGHTPAPSALPGKV